MCQSCQKNVCVTYIRHNSPNWDTGMVEFVVQTSIVNPIHQFTLLNSIALEIGAIPKMKPIVKL